MKREQVELVVIGGGPAGMAAALGAYEQGVRSIVILERDRELGGILQQCIHNGFGLHYFGEELTGPEYAGRFIRRVQDAGIRVLTNTMVLEVTEGRQVYAVNRVDGMTCFQAEAVVLAMGCRERTREAIAIAGTRPAGVFTAGTAQRYINMEGYLPGKQVLILGSGDIGLIMARRMTLEGAEVKGVLEIMPYSNGLNRNIVQCLDDFQIPLMLEHTVVEVHGRERIKGVTIARVDGAMQPIAGSERYLEVDTLLLSVGLIPENELTRGVGILMDLATGGAVVNQYRETRVSGVFACGNVLHVHDLVDYVTEEAILAGRGAAKWIAMRRGCRIEVESAHMGSNNVCDGEMGLALPCDEEMDANDYADGSGDLGVDLSKSSISEISGEVEAIAEMVVTASTNVRYVVPQRLVMPVEEDVEFYLRVIKPLERGEVVMRCGDEIVYRKKERCLRPAEMVKVRLRAGVCKGAVLTVTVEEVG